MNQRGQTFLDNIVDLIQWVDICIFDYSKYNSVFDYFILLSKIYLICDSTIIKYVNIYLNFYSIKACAMNLCFFCFFLLSKQTIYSLEIHMTLFLSTVCPKIEFLSRWYH